MIVQSHNLMSNLIYGYIEENTNLDLNRLRFKIGNMSPDLPLYHSHMKHYKNQNYGYILDMIKELTKMDPTESKDTLKDYSYRLGVVCHYMCDYFCLPHHSRRYFHDKLGEHLVYEKDLHKIIKKFTREDYRAEYSLDSAIEKHSNSPVNLIDMIEDFHYDYMDAVPSFETDTSYAITITSILASVIVKASLGEIAIADLDYELVDEKLIEALAF